MRALQSSLCTHTLEYFQIKSQPCTDFIFFPRLSLDIMNFQILFFQLQENKINFMKFSTADKCFCWLSNNIFLILYPKCISDPATGNADFWLSSLVAEMNFISKITSFVLDLLQFVCTWQKSFF